MTNILLYINRNIRIPCQLNLSEPSIDTSNILVPEKTSLYLLYDNFLSEYNTLEEKRLIMLNILLFDNIPKENSEKLVNSGTVFKIMRESKLMDDLLTQLINNLQRTKADKSELFNYDYRDLVNTPKNLSDFNNDLNFVQLLDLENYYDKNEIDNIILNISLDNIDLSGYATQEYVLNQINNLIDGAPEALNTLKEITDKLYADGDIVNLILNLINEKANKSDVYTKIQLDNLLEIEQENISGKAENSDLLQTNELIQQLLNRILLLESKLENIKHEILTQEMYDNLQQYDPYTVYFIVEQLPPTPINKNYWAFGLGFPIIFSERWTFGDEFPIILGPEQESLEEEPLIDNNGYEYIDLGLPSGTLWAKYNVGASSETDYGNYYQYGKGAAQYAITSGDSNYNGIEDPLDSSVDTVAQVWGGSWHMPTRTQMQELTANTTYQWVTNYKGSGINGGTFTATNGAVLFFPATGYWRDDSLSTVGDYGRYWGSSPSGSNSACLLYFYNGYKGVSNSIRESGYSVRGVLDNNNQ